MSPRGHHSGVLRRQRRIHELHKCQQAGPEPLQGQGHLGLCFRAFAGTMQYQYRLEALPKAFRLSPPWLPSPHVTTLPSARRAAKARPVDLSRRTFHRQRSLGRCIVASLKPKPNNVNITAQFEARFGALAALRCSPLPRAQHVTHRCRRLQLQKLSKWSCVLCLASRSLASPTCHRTIGDDGCKGSHVGPDLDNLPGQQQAPRLQSSRQLQALSGPARVLRRSLLPPHVTSRHSLPPQQHSAMGASEHLSAAQCAETWSKEGEVNRREHSELALSRCRATTEPSRRVKAKAQERRLEASDGPV